MKPAATAWRWTHRRHTSTGAASARQHATPAMLTDGSVTSGKRIPVADDAGDAQRDEEPRPPPARAPQRPDIARGATHGRCSGCVRSRPVPARFHRLSERDRAFERRQHHRNREVRPLANAPRAPSTHALRIANLGRAARDAGDEVQRRADRGASARKGAPAGHRPVRAARGRARVEPPRGRRRRCRCPSRAPKSAASTVSGPPSTGMPDRQHQERVDRRCGWPAWSSRWRWRPRRSVR